MKGYRFITSDDTSEFCHRVTEAISNGWKLYGEPKMTFDKKRGVMRCAQAVIKKFTSQKVFQKDEAIIDINGRSDITLCLYARDTLISTPSFSTI